MLLDISHSSSSIMLANTDVVASRCASNPNVPLYFVLQSVEIVRGARGNRRVTVLD